MTKQFILLCKTQTNFIIYLLFSLVSGFVKKFIKARKNDDGLLKVRYILSDECKWDHMT
jgi:hypothetical protein